MRHIVAFVTVVTFLLTAGSGGVAAAEVADAGLLDAIKAADAAGVRAALGRGVDVAAADLDGTTPLHWAVHANDATIVELLLAAGAEAQAANRHGVRPIALACTNGNAAIVELLLNAGVDGNATLAHGETALMTAARTGAPDVVELLLDHGADVNATETWRGQTALMWAAAEGHAELLPMLVSHGADIAARSTKGWTALLFAAREGHIDAVQTLLEAGADIEEALPVEPYERRAGTSAGRPSTGLNALLMATHNAHFELGALLVDRGADVNVALRGWTVLHQVSWVRKTSIPGGSNEAPPEGTGSMTGIDLVRKVVAAGADVNARVTDRPPVGSTRMNFIGGTPFLLAARTGDAELMRVLAELGADPLLPNEDNTTPILVAAGVGSAGPGQNPGTAAEVLEALQVALELGGDLDGVDDNGETVMHGAAFAHLPSLAKFLVQAGAPVDVWNQPNARGWTPLDIAEGVQSDTVETNELLAATIRQAMEAAGVPVPSRVQ